MLSIGQPSRQIATVLINVSCERGRNSAEIRLRSKAMGGRYHQKYNHVK